MSRGGGRRLAGAGVAVLALVAAPGAWALMFPVDFDPCQAAPPGCGAADPCQVINATVGTAINDTIEAIDHGGVPVAWEIVAPPAGCTPVVVDQEYDCNGVFIDATSDPISVSSAPSPTGFPTAAGTFTFGVEGDNGSITCAEGFQLVIAPFGDTGDPHLTTVEGVHYDFQSDGEFVSLRSADLEIQTRKTGIATSFFPNANPYTGLATCVSVNTAVAARVGSRRVTYQPNLSGVPDPSGLQLRIDGVLTELGAEGIDLGSGGRIQQTAAEGGIQIDFPDGTRLLVTPGWWVSQAKWYLNVTLYATTASEGLLGALAPKSWLPALPDGTSLGPRPSALPERFTALYKTFADAWRVTAATSLFDYAPGTSTADFTLASWPRDSPPCELPRGEFEPPGPVSDPVDVEVAEQACAPITNANRRANCVFDVRVTGELGFADTYLATQQLELGEPVTGGARPDEWAFSLHLGYPFALGDFDDLGADGKLSAAIDLEWRFAPRRSLELVFGRYAFEIDPGAVDVDIDGLSVYYKEYSAPVGSSRLFWQVGPGAFDVQPGLSTFGVSGGGGWQSPLGSNLELELAGLLFRLFSTGAQDDIDFLLVQAGLKLTF